VAGATATGTHGSGDRNGILSTAVSAVDLVTSDGALLTVNRANADLKALAVGLGAFGLITRLVLDIQPTYLVRQGVYRNAPWDTVLEAFDEVMAGAYSVSLIGDFASPVGPGALAEDAGRVAQGGPRSARVCASASPGASIRPRSWPYWPTSRPRSGRTSRDPIGASYFCSPPRTLPDASPGCRSSST
jgi:FAD/FMN-containing dehydrogenase